MRKTPDKTHIHDLRLSLVLCPTVSENQKLEDLVLLGKGHYPVIEQVRRGDRMSDFAKLGEGPVV